MLKQRIITALVMALIILLALVFLPFIGFSLLLIAVFSVAAWEWADLSGFAGLWRYLYALALAAVMLTLAWYCGLFHGVNIDCLRDIFGVAGIGWAIALLWVMSYPGSAALWGSRFMRATIGLVVLVPSALALIYLTSLDNGKWYFVYMVLIVAAADIGAYFSGRAFGKRKLAPHVSPGKSWAGFFGGLLSTALLAVITSSFFSIADLGMLQLLLVTLFAGLASVLGDLLESMVKRHRGIKDSSQLLPGHGGIMDRIDSVTAAAPVFALLLILLQQAA